MTEGWEVGNQIESHTQLQACMAKKGTVMVKENLFIGRLSARYNVTCGLTGIVLWQPGQESERFRGAQVSIERAGEDEESEAAFLDMDELDSLSSALSYLVEVGHQWSGEKREYVEVTYKSADEFTVGFFQQQQKQVPFMNTGSAGRLSAFLSSLDDLTKFKSLCDAAIVRLREK